MMAACAKPRKMTVKWERTGAKLPPLKVRDPRSAAYAAAKLIGDNAYEVFLVMYLNSDNCVIGYEELTEDSLAGVSVNTASLVRNALLAGAFGIITAHQHPSGSLTPSRDDQVLWKRLRQQAELMQIPVLDNLIVTEDGYYTEQEEVESSW